tara:strand:+ start:24435 stop:28862 length:4428 start_codon:yes stop_codon:yes gene_type:complete
VSSAPTSSTLIPQSVLDNTGVGADAPAGAPFRIPTTPEPLIFETQRESLDRAVAAAKANQGGVGVIGAAVNVESLIGTVARIGARLSIAPDSSFPGLWNLPKEQFNQIVEGVPSQYWTALEGADSMEELVLLRRQMLQLVDSEQTLQGAGVGGFTARMGAAIFDPGAFLIGGGVGALAKAKRVAQISASAAKTLRRDAIIRGGMLAGTENAVVEAMLAAENPDKGATDILFAFGGGILLGGAGAAWVTRDIGKAEDAAQNLQDSITGLEAQRAAEASGGRVTINQEAIDRALKGKDPTSRTDQHAIADDLAKAYGLDEEDLVHVHQAIDAGHGDTIIGNMTRLPEDAAARSAAAEPEVGMGPERAEELQARQEEAAASEMDAVDPTRTLEDVADEIDTLVREMGLAQARGDLDLADELAERLKALEDEAASAPVRTEPRGGSVDVPRVVAPAGTPADVARALEELADISPNVAGLQDNLRRIQESLRMEIDALEAERRMLLDDSGLPREGTTDRLGEIHREISSLKRRAEREGLVLMAQDADVDPPLTIGVPNQPGSGTELMISDQFSPYFQMKGELVGQDAGAFALKLPGVDAPRIFAPWQLMNNGRRLGQPTKQLYNRLLAEGLEDAAIRREFERVREQIKNRKEVPRPAKKMIDFDAEGMADFTRQGRFGPARISMVGQLASHVVPAVRGLMGVLAQDAVPIRGVQRLTASLWGSREHHRYMAAFWSVANPAWRRWAKAQGVRRSFNIQKQREFFETVTKAMRDHTDAKDPNVRAVVDAMRTITEDVIERAKAHGVRGSELIEATRTYVPRIYRMSQIHKIARAEGGTTRLHELFEKALITQHDDLTETVAKKWAKGIVTVLVNSKKYTDFERAQIVAGEAKDFMRVAMDEATDSVTGEKLMTKAEVDEIMRLVAPAHEQRPLTSRLRHRNALNEKAALDDGLSIEDLLENDARALMQTYSRQMTGAMAMSEVLQEMGRAVSHHHGGGRAVQFTQPIDLETYLRRQMVDAGMKETAINRDMKKISILMNSVQGKPIWPDNDWSNFMANLRLYNYLRVGGQFGIAQVPEFGALLGSAGIGAIARQMPAFAQIWSRAKDGKMSNQLLQEIETIFVQGVAWKNSNVVPRTDIEEAMLTDVYKEGARVNEAFRKVARAQGALSLMAPIHVAQQRMVAALAIQKFADIAWNRGKIGKSRLAQLGLTEAQGKQIAAAIDRHASKQEGMFGKKITALNMDEWSAPEDIDAARMLLDAVTLWSNRVVQENDIGNMTKWMTTDIGRIISQFRAFTLVAYEKQFLGRVAMIMDGKRGDRESAWRAGMELSFSMTFAALGHMAWSHVSAASAEDPAEFLEDALSPSRVASVAFQRAGWTHLMPDIADSMMWFAGADESIFNFRTSGLANSSIHNMESLIGNSSFDSGDRLLKIFRHSFSSLTKEGDLIPTPAQWRNATSLLPLNRAQPIYGLLEVLGNTVSDE